MSSSFIRGKQLLLGVSGSVAAYKALYLTRLCVEAGAEVWPVLTPSAARFIGPLSFAALSGHRPVTDLWSPAEAGEIGHVELAHRVDLLVLAPATADLLARLAAGRADDPLCAIALATPAPWLVAPAMESGMWTSPATQAHVEALRRRGARFVEPTEGELASGRSGVGRLAEPEVIFEAILEALGPADLTGERVLVSAGPTREAFDPARFVSNASSGKMGYALARAAKLRGAQVHLVSGPTQLAPPAGVAFTPVETTGEMLEACRGALDWSTVLVMAAAPCDFKPAQRAEHKLKKTDEPLTVALERTPDVLQSLRARSRERLVVGFAAESRDVLTYARDKLVAKDLDLIVANDITEPGAGFATDTNRVDLLDRDGTHTPLPRLGKEAVAHAILDRVAALRRNRAE